MTHARDLLAGIADLATRAEDDGRGWLTIHTAAADLVAMLSTVRLLERELRGLRPASSPSVDLAEEAAE